MRAVDLKGKLKGHLVKFLRDEVNELPKLQVRVMNCNPVQISDDGLFYFEISKHNKEVLEMLKKNVGEGLSDKMLLLEFLDWRFSFNRIPNSVSYFYDIELNEFTCKELTGFIGEKKSGGTKRKSNKRAKLNKNIFHDKNVDFAEEKNEVDSRDKKGSAGNMVISIDEVDSFGKRSTEKVRKRGKSCFRSLDNPDLEREMLTMFADFSLDEMKRMIEDKEVMEEFKKRSHIMLEKSKKSKYRWSSAKKKNPSRRYTLSSSKKSNIGLLGGFNQNPPSFECSEKKEKKSPKEEQKRSKGGIGMGPNGVANYKKLVGMRRKKANTLNFNSQDSMTEFLEKHSSPLPRCSEFNVFPEDSHKTEVIQNSGNIEKLSREKATAFITQQTFGLGFPDSNKQSLYKETNEMEEEVTGVPDISDISISDIWTLLGLQGERFLMWNDLIFNRDTVNYLKDSLEFVPKRKQ